MIIGQLRVAEFFAGIGLVRLALEAEGFQVVWANDNDPAKRALYAAQFGAADFRLGDVRAVRGADLPDVELATASFPCTDLSLAGLRAGLGGQQSGMFWEFARVLRELGPRRPPLVLLENVPSFATSRGGQDLALALTRLNRLGYCCDLLVVDARHFTPQSRPRLFIIGSRAPLVEASDWRPSTLRPAWVERFVQAHPRRWLQALPLDAPASAGGGLEQVVERLAADDPRWWPEERLAAFLAQLAPAHRVRLQALQAGPELGWATAFRRTRHGRPAWEIRADAISGCLRTARGGSSKQALVEAGQGAWRARWMTGREYARLQGAGDYQLDGTPEGRALFGFGDAVCVPVIAWLARSYLRPALDTVTNGPFV